ncbi:hypothetical protein H3V53_03580 [Paraburkholderia bengalensis]|uniref:VOC domain-containing protein n=1 Tax=Paraburkholderia bengalensis TaxID=2747562 RepID=A0ABU8ILU7_9BURK
MKIARIAAIIVALCASSVAAFAQTNQPASNTGISKPPSSVASHIKSTYVRVILPNSQAQPLIDRYTHDLNGRVHYDFEMRDIKARMIGITSPHGNISAQITDNAASFDQWRRDTRLLYEVDDVPATLKAAEEAGFKIVQPLNRTVSVWQGRYEVVPGFVVEVVTWLPGKEPRND